MKKYYHTIWIYIISFSLVVFVLTATTGQVQAPQPKMLTVTLPLDDWNALIFSVNNKNAKGVTVILDQSILDNMVAQLNKQLADTTTKKK